MKSIKSYLKKPFYSVCTYSLKKAALKERLNKLITKLEEIVPDIRDQYSMFKLDTKFLKTKARNMHAFQMSLVDKVIGEFKAPTIVDIGDSAGTHLQYILGLYSQGKDIQALSVNMDPEAVERIRKKGLKALKARAEDLRDYDIDADIFLCFEALEHLTDPCRFLRQLSLGTNAKYLIITVPYLKNSRVGLHHIRAGGRHQGRVTAENTHIFELSPKDWKLIARHSGWSIRDERIYLQYPKRGFLGITRPLWRKFDFEGFYGLILKKDNTWSSKYLDW